MKVCVTAASDSLDAEVDPRFGRCQFFVIVDSETMQHETVPNTAAGAMRGAGIQAAQLIADKGATVVITGNIGPNAFQALSTAGIKVIADALGTVRQVVERSKKGELKGETSAPTVGGHFGRGGGRGRSGARGQ